MNPIPTNTITHFLVLCCLLFAGAAEGQSRAVAITIDDVPNTTLYRQDGFKSQLLSRIDSLNIPVAIFINEKNLFNNNFYDAYRQGLKGWLDHQNVTAGNHSYRHMNYADTSFSAFAEDVLRGEVVTRQITGTPVTYFRFPFNSLGKDSAAHRAMGKFLADHGYTNTPFTIESEDWAFNARYEEALGKRDHRQAAIIGKAYVDHTLLLFDYFESLSKTLYGRNLKHIYLCHDNALNTDFLVELVTHLRARGYTLVSLHESLQDPVYQSMDYYTGPFGFSWIYRWQSDEIERKRLMRAEPPNKFLSE